MITPFEQRVKRCIEAFNRLRTIHSELNIAAREFKAPHWTVAFDQNGQFIGAVLTEGGRQLIASETGVRIDGREWR